MTDAERETAALAFVGEHHPELATLLARLKPMRPAEYAKAVRELAQTSRSLEDLKARDPRRYELGLDVWKTRSRVELLTARLASEPSARPSPELESQLRQAVEAQIDAQTRQQRFERDQTELRLTRLNENLKRLEANRDAIVASRVQTLLKKNLHAPTPRRPDTGAVATGTGKARPKSAPDQTRTKADDNDNARDNSTKGERLP
jgi:hypothetical protein